MNNAPTDECMSRITRTRLLTPMTNHFCNVSLPQVYEVVVIWDGAVLDVVASGV
jgi:hypothetical protein